MPKNRVNYNLKDALAFAIVAFDSKSGRIDRDDFAATDNRPATVSNRTMILDALEGRARLIVSTKQKTDAEGMVKYLEQVSIMQKLKGRRDSAFLQNIIELLNKETVTGRDLGLLAWAPKVAADYQGKDALAEKTASYEMQSQWVGKIKDRITIKFTALETRYVKNLNLWSVFGHDEHGNLYQFWANSQDRAITEGSIDARVKKHINDEYRNNTKVTMINYVKKSK